MFFGFLLLINEGKFVLIKLIICYVCNRLINRKLVSLISELFISCDFCLLLSYYNVICVY